MTDNTEPSLRDRTMALLLELQKSEENEVNAAERQLLNAADSRKAQQHQAMVDLFHPKVDGEGEDE